MGESRTKKTIRNTFFSFVYQVSDILLNFLLRTIFIHTLGRSYLGLSGLFSNILTVLSFMDLGIGGAIVFCLYKPLSEGDNGKIRALMLMYKRVYTFIGCLVCGVGVMLTPFLDKIINLPNNIEHLYWIYWLSIANTAILYFLAYKRSLLIADQRSDINVKNSIIFKFSRFFLLASSLIIVHNYIIYLSLEVLNTLISNIHIAYVVKKRYLYLEKVEASPINKNEKQQIIKYISSGIFAKFGQTIVNCTDSIIISAFISTITVGLYSNYSMITSSLDSAVYIVFSGITASIGNFAVEKSDIQAERLFKKITFINYIIVQYLVVCLAALLSPFVNIWAGVDYVLSDTTVAIIILNFYFAALQKSIECFMGANGAMYYHNRYRSLLEGIVNLVASIILVRYTDLGITGVFLGTTLCFLLGRVWMDAFVLYRYWFKCNYIKYILRYLYQFSLTIITASIGKLFSNILFHYFGLNIFTWICTGIVLTVGNLFITWCLFRKKEEFIFLKTLLAKQIHKYFYKNYTF